MLKEGIFYKAIQKDTVTWFMIELKVHFIYDSISSLPGFHPGSRCAVNGCFQGRSADPKVLKQSSL